MGLCSASPKQTSCAESGELLVVPRMFTGYAQVTERFVSLFFGGSEFECGDRGLFWRAALVPKVVMPAIAATGDKG